MHWLQVFAFGVLAALSHSIYATETILNFHSDIIINKDASLDVTETITVNAENRDIKHGIYRDFPTIYRDNHGLEYHVDFILKSIKLDGKPSNYDTQGMSNGIRIYIGDKNNYVSQGTHTYQIAYNVTRELGFFGNFDELYWNVTGNGWLFPIEKASATIHLPGSFKQEQLQWSAYNGLQGAKNNDYNATLIADNKVEFTLTKPLKKQEGFTVAVSWPKGYIDEPLPQNKIKLLFRDNPRLATMLTGLFVVSGYYLLVWLWLAKKHTIAITIPRYELLASVSPALMRYVYKMGYDKKVFAAAMMNLIVKNQILISNKIKNNIDKFLFPDEEIIKSEWSNHNKKFKQEMINSNEYIQIQKKAKVYKDHRNYFKLFFSKKVFDKNVPLIFIGLLISSIFIFLSKGISFEAPFIFKSIIVFCVVGAIFYNKTVYEIDEKDKEIFTSIGLFLFSVLTLFIVSGGRDLIYTLYVSFIICINILFIKKMKVYTEEGMKIINYALGFREYLTVAEQHYLNVDEVPASVSEYFERLLPYAMALDLETAWSNKLAQLIPTETNDLSDSHAHVYQLSINRMKDFNTNISLVSDISGAAATSASIAAAANPPGSQSGSTGGGVDSGSGGGGSSGGGSSGGGGGGW